MPPLQEDLAVTVRRYIKNWKFMSRVYASISVVLKGTLIIASALVAAKTGLKDIFKELTFMQLGILVAIGTSFDAWLKPRDKWKGFMADHEKAGDLLMQLDNTPKENAERIDELRKEFQAILDKHREKNVF